MIIKKGDEKKKKKWTNGTNPLSISNFSDIQTVLDPWFCHKCLAITSSGNANRIILYKWQKKHTHTHNNETIQEGFPITITVKFVVHTSTNREATAITIKGTIGCTQYHGWNEHFARQLLQRKMPQIASGTNMLAEERERWICPTLFCWGRMKNTQVNQ